MKIRVEFASKTKDGVIAAQEALKALLETGSVESMEIDSIGIGGPIGDRLKQEGYKQVSIKEHYRCLGRSGGGAE